jgi:hypothetical protein
MLLAFTIDRVVLVTFEVAGAALEPIRLGLEAQIVVDRGLGKRVAVDLDLDKILRGLIDGLCLLVMK